MAEDVGQAYVGIVPSLDGFSARMRAELAAGLRGVDAPVKDAGHKAGQGFGDGLREGIRTKLSGIASLLKTGLVAGGAAVAAGLGALTLFGLKSAASLEQTQIGIEALTGSAEEAKKFLGELQQFAATTPFEFQGVADASRRILAFGQAVGITRDEVIPTITTIGDLVSVLGGSQENIDSVVRALGQISSKGKVSQEELLQLAEALPGFNANAAIASALGLSVGDSMDAITRGEVDATTGINALLAGMAQFPGAAGAMAQQSQTLLGVFSTFKDTLAIALTNAFQPVIPAIKDSLADITPILGGAIDQLAPSLGGLLASLLPLLAQVVQALVPVLQPLLDGLNGFIDQLRDSGVLQALGDALGVVLKAASPLLPIFGELLVAIVIPLIPVIEALAPVIKELVPPLAEILRALTPLIPPLAEILVAVAELLVPIAKLIGFLVDLATKFLIAPIVEILAFQIDLLAQGISALAGWLTSIDWGAVWSAITSAVGGFFDTIGTFFHDLPGNVVEFLKSLPEKLQTAAKDSLQKFAYAVGLGIGLALAFFRDMPGKVLEFLKELPGRLVEFFTDTQTQVRSSIVEGLERFLEVWRELPGNVISAILGLRDKLQEFAADLAGRAWQLGKDIVQGAIDGIKATVSGIGHALSEGFANALNGVKDGLGIHSPSTVYMEIGEQTIAGYVRGVEQSARDASAATMAALAPATASSTATTTAPPQRVSVDTNDPLILLVLARLREAIRETFGGDVDLALASV